MQCIYCCLAMIELVVLIRASYLACCVYTHNANRFLRGLLELGNSLRHLLRSAYPDRPRPCLLRGYRVELRHQHTVRKLAIVQRTLCLVDRLHLRKRWLCVSISTRAIQTTTDIPQVFSKHLAVSILSRNNPSETGLMARPAFEQSVKVQNVGMMIILAPCDIISLKASGNARSQQMSIPTLPSGVSNTG